MAVIIQFIIYVYDIQSTSTQSDSRVTGVQMRYQNNPKIYYNSVYLSGTGTNKYGSAALYVSNNCTNIDAKNNILVNNRDESPYCASAIYDYDAQTLHRIIMIFIMSQISTMLSKNRQYEIQHISRLAGNGKDLNSITEMPNFCITLFTH